MEYNKQDFAYECMEIVNRLIRNEDYEKASIVFRYMMNGVTHDEPKFYGLAIGGINWYLKEGINSKNLYTGTIVEGLMKSWVLQDRHNEEVYGGHDIEEDRKAFEARAEYCRKSLDKQIN